MNTREERKQEVTIEQQTILNGVTQGVPELRPQTSVLCSSWGFKEIVPLEWGQLVQDLPTC